MLNAFTYDDEGRITSKFDGNRLLSWDEKQFIDYDDDGRIISERNEGYYGDSTENPSNTTQKSYTYDWLGRVATETTDGVTTSYEYDEVGNLTSKTTGDLTTTYKINELDQVTEVKTNDNVIQATYTYDLSGNRTTKYSYGATTTYTYDGQNNLTSIAGDQQTTSTYTYDANGERLTKLNQTHTTQYYYDGVNLLFTKRNNSIDVRYLYDEGTLYAAIAADGLPYWYNVDLRGSVTNIIKGDTTGSITTSLNKSYVYDAYGNTSITSTSEFRNAVAYTGAIYDEETGLYYLMSRYYDPALAQFISEDSYRGDGEHFWNLYMYCEGDPVNNIDREGEKTKKVTKKEKKPKWYTNKTLLKAKDGLSLVTRKKSVYTEREALDKIYKYNKAVLSSCFGGVNANMVRAILFRELICYGIDDPVADLMVREGLRSDSSTGIGQIFASTAIKAYEFVYEKKWKKSKLLMWEALQDNTTNIKYVAFVLAMYSKEVGVNLHKSKSDSNLKKVFSRYNGTNNNAKKYGAAVLSYYKEFAKG